MKKWNMIAIILLFGIITIMWFYGAQDSEEVVKHINDTYDDWEVWNDDWNWTNETEDQIDLMMKDLPKTQYQHCYIDLETGTNSCGSFGSGHPDPESNQTAIPEFPIFMIPLFAVALGYMRKVVL